MNFRKPKKDLWQSILEIQIKFEILENDYGQQVSPGKDPFNSFQRLMRRNLKLGNFPQTRNLQILFDLVSLYHTSRKFKPHTLHYNSKKMKHLSQVRQKLRCLLELNCAEILFNEDFSNQLQTKKTTLNIERELIGLNDGQDHLFTRLLRRIACFLGIKEPHHCILSYSKSGEPIIKPGLYQKLKTWLVSKKSKQSPKPKENEKIENQDWKYQLDSIIEQTESQNNLFNFNWIVKLFISKIVEWIWENSEKCPEYNRWIIICDALGQDVERKWKNVDFVKHYFLFIDDLEAIFQVVERDSPYHFHVEKIAQIRMFYKKFNKILRKKLPKHYILKGQCQEILHLILSKIQQDSRKKPISKQKSMEIRHQIKLESIQILKSIFSIKNLNFTISFYMKKLNNAQFDNKLQLLKNPNQFLNKFLGGIIEGFKILLTQIIKKEIELSNDPNVIKNKKSFFSVISNNFISDFTFLLNSKDIKAKLSQIIVSFFDFWKLRLLLSQSKKSALDLYRENITLYFLDNHHVQSAFLATINLFELYYSKNLESSDFDFFEVLRRMIVFWVFSGKELSLKLFEDLFLFLNGFKDKFGFTLVPLMEEEAFPYQIYYSDMVLSMSIQIINSNFLVRNLKLWLERTDINSKCFDESSEIEEDRIMESMLMVLIRESRDLSFSPNLELFPNFLFKKKV